MTGTPRPIASVSTRPPKLSNQRLGMTARPKGVTEVGNPVSSKTPARSTSVPSGTASGGHHRPRDARRGAYGLASPFHQHIDPFLGMERPNVASGVAGERKIRCRKLQVSQNVQQICTTAMHRSPPPAVRGAAGGPAPVRVKLDGVGGTVTRRNNHPDAGAARTRMHQRGSSWSTPAKLPERAGGPRQRQDRLVQTRPARDCVGYDGTSRPVMRGTSGRSPHAGGRGYRRGPSPIWRGIDLDIHARYSGRKGGSGSDGEIHGDCTPEPKSSRNTRPRPLARQADRLSSLSRWKMPTWCPRELSAASVCRTTTSEPPPCRWKLSTSRILMAQAKESFSNLMRSSCLRSTTTIGCGSNILGDRPPQVATMNPRPTRTTWKNRARHQEPAIRAFDQRAWTVWRPKPASGCRYGRRRKSRPAGSHAAPSSRASLSRCSPNSR